MLQKRNIIGQNVRRFRCQNGWTQDDLVAKLQLLDCYMTRDILTKIETCYSFVTDKQIDYFAEVFGVEASMLFSKPNNKKGNKYDQNIQEQRGQSEAVLR